MFNLLFKHSLYQFVTQILVASIGLVNMSIIAKEYGTTGVGILGLYYATTGIYSTVIKFGLDRSALRLIPEQKAINHEAIFNLIRLITIIFSSMTIATIAITIINFDNIINFSPDGYLIKNYLFIFIFGSILMAINHITHSILRSLSLNNTFFFSQVLLACLSCVFISVGTQLYTEVSVVLSIIAAYFITNLYILAKLLKNLISLRIRSSHKNNLGFVHVVKISIPLFLLALVGALNANYSVILVSKYLNSVDLGLFIVSMKIALTSGILLKCINLIAAPKLASLYFEQNLVKLRYLAQAISAISILCTIIIVSVFYLFGQQIILIVFGPEFKMVYWYALLLFAAQIFNSFTGPSGSLLELLGNEKSYLYINLLCTILYFIMIYVNIEILGLLGVLLSFIAYEFLVNILSQLKIWQSYRFLTVPTFSAIKYMRLQGGR